MNHCLAVDLLPWDDRRDVLVDEHFGGEVGQSRKALWLEG